MATNHIGNPTEVLAPASAPSLTSPLVQSCPDDGDDLDAASVNQALQSPGNLLAYLQELLRTQYFGAAGDGNIHITGGGSGSLFGYSFFDTVQIDHGNYNPNCWPIFCRTSFTTTINTAVINAFGGSGAGSVSGNYGIGGSGGPHGCVAPSDGLGAAGTYNYNGSEVYGLGGNGGAGGGGAPSGTQLIDPAGAHKLFPWRAVAGQGGIGIRHTGSDGVFYAGSRFDSIRGGGAGSPGGSAANATPGGAGAAGQLLVIVAPKIELAAGTNINLGGGNGGNGASTGGLGNGGGAGGGGACLFVCCQFIDHGAIYNVPGGTGGFGVGGGAAGSNGSNGNATPYVVLVGP